MNTDTIVSSILNFFKIILDTVTQHFINVEGLQLVSGKECLDHTCFMIDPHCANLLTFHYTLRNRITNHEFVKDYKLIIQVCCYYFSYKKKKMQTLSFIFIQDKSSCLAPLTVQKLLYKNDDVILTDVGGGLVAAYLGCIMKELDGRVFVFGATSDEKYEEITNKMKLIGCSKCNLKVFLRINLKIEFFFLLYTDVKVMREKFPDDKTNDKLDEKVIEKLLNVKVILINAPCSKSALMNPMEFLFQEGSGMLSIEEKKKKKHLFYKNSNFKMYAFYVIFQLIIKMKNGFYFLLKKKKNY